MFISSVVIEFLQWTRSIFGTPQNSNEQDSWLSLADERSLELLQEHKNDIQAAMDSVCSMLGCGKGWLYCSDCFDEYVYPLNLF
jgi:hypothetical protein